MSVIFRHKADYAKIGATQQKDKEPVDKCRARFEKVFKMNSGLQDDGLPAGVYQQQPKKCLARSFKT